MTWLEGENTFEAYMPVGVGASASSYSTFILPHDQSDVAKLRSADWMTATVTKARTDADRSIKLAFAHKLAKVTVKIAGYRSEFGTTPPTIDGLQFQFPAIDPLTGVTTFAPTGITPFVTADQSAAALHSYTAILAPGKYDTDGTFVKMNVNGQAISTRGNELLTGTGLEGGKSYTFELTVGKDVVTINSFTVADWNTGEDLTAITPGLKIANENGANGFPIYEIYNADGLKAFADIVHGTDDGRHRTFCGIEIPGQPSSDSHMSNARLMADIDLSSVCSQALGKSWRPIGVVNMGGARSYQGVFEGNLHTVKGLYIDDTRVNFVPDPIDRIHQGLFGYLLDATVQNLTVEGNIHVSISSSHSQQITILVGGIAGQADNSFLMGCHSAVNISVEGDAAAIMANAGGMVGRTSNGGISNCSSTGTISSTASSRESAGLINTGAYVGGICGSVSGALSGCSHTVGAVSATSSNGQAHVGGVAGQFIHSGQLWGCTNTAEVKGSATGTNDYCELYIGGVVGKNERNAVACSNSGDIFYNAERDLYAGGVAGRSSVSIVASFTTKIPTLSQGGSSGEQARSYIGGVLGYLSNNTTPVSTCFYVGGNDLGTNGVSFVVNNGTTNTDGGRVADLVTLNGKVKAMNMSVAAYNTANPDQACPYHWTQTPDGLQLRK